MICYGSQTLVSACDQIQAGILFMILKSEGSSTKNVTEPQRDRKYTAVAYARLLNDCAREMPIESKQQVLQGLLELLTLNTRFAGIQALDHKSPEEMLLEGAVDQEIAFNRTTFVQLTAAKIEPFDRLEKEVPNIEQFVLSSVRDCCASTNTSVSSLLTDEK